MTDWLDTRAGPAVAEPGIVMVAGDWHGNRPWAVSEIWKTRRLAAPRIILQLGDFGFWPWQEKDWAPGERRPAGLRYLLDIQAALELTQSELWVTPGNHEWYDKVNEWLAAAPGDDRVPVPGCDRIFILRRGARWEWHGRTWLSAGGAVSVDRKWPRPGRVPGVSWWPAEELTGAEAGAIIAAGHADVIVAHDYPARVQHSFGAGVDHHLMPVFHPDDLARARLHSERMQAIVDGVKPSYYMHGHLHRLYGRTYDWGWGPVRVTGLDMDGTPGNTKFLDTFTMQWQVS